MSTLAAGIDPMELEGGMSATAGVQRKGLVGWICHLQQQEVVAQDQQAGDAQVSRQ